MSERFAEKPVDVWPRIKRGIDLFDLMVSALRVVLRHNHPQATNDYIEHLVRERLQEIERWTKSAEYQPVYPSSREVYTVEWWERQCRNFPDVAGLP